MNSLSLHVNIIFPDRPGLAGTRMAEQLELYDMQVSRQIITTNKPTLSSTPFLHRGETTSTNCVKKLYKHCKSLSHMV